MVEPQNRKRKLTKAEAGRLGGLKGGRARTALKLKRARENGRKGGAPRGNKNAIGRTHARTIKRLGLKRGARQ